MPWDERLKISGLMDGASQKTIVFSDEKGGTWQMPFALCPSASSRLEWGLNAWVWSSHPNEEVERNWRGWVLMAPLSPAWTALWVRSWSVRCTQLSVTSSQSNSKWARTSKPPNSVQILYGFAHQSSSWTTASNAPSMLVFPTVDSQPSLLYMVPLGYLI